jgi:cell division septation protein DedD
MNRGTLALLFLLSGAIAGCGTGEEAARHTERESPEIPPRMFEIRTDTVDAVEGPRTSTERDSTDETGTGFALQIGAFRDPRNASAAQTAARSRFEVPVTNEYNVASALYYIRAGFFRSRAEASLFRESIVRRFPAEYSDSWIVEVKRTP